MSAFTTSNFTLSSVAPGSPQQGDFWYNTTTSTMLAFAGTGTGWVGANPYHITAQNLSATSVSFTAFVAPNTGETWKIQAASVVFGTAGGAAAAVTVEVATGTQAVGAGTAQLTATMALTGAAATTVNGTVVAAPTAIAAGNRVNVILSGTLTGLANCCVTVTLQKTA